MKNKYVFVARVTTDASGRTSPFVANTIITNLFPEFLVSY